MLHPGSRCGYVFGLVLSMLAFVLPSFFLKEGSIFRKWRRVDLVAVLFGYAFVCTTDGLYVYLMKNDTLYD